MKIGIHNNNSAYSQRWIEYCSLKKIDYKVVNAYDNDIVHQLKDCDVFMWHHQHGDYRDVNFAKQLLFSLQQSGITVFPDFNSGWHFDDKLGQKYLFEANDIQMAESFAFYDKKSAFKWVAETNFPKIFKLRGGAGSANVKMVRDKKTAKKLVRKAFGKGFKAFDYSNLAIDHFKLTLKGRSSFIKAIKYLALAILPQYSKSSLLPKHKGYVYFQEFIPNDGYDIRIQITGEKALAMVRYTREGDFRASGSNNLSHNSDLLTSDIVKSAFEIARKLQLQSCALDFVRDNRDGKLYVIENSYCYGVDDDEFDYGYWTSDGVFHEDITFNGLDWIIESLGDFNK